MQTFRHRPEGLELAAGVVWQLGEIAEAKGRQAVLQQRAPEVFEGLRAQAPRIRFRCLPGRRPRPWTNCACSTDTRSSSGRCRPWSPWRPSSSI